MTTFPSSKSKSIKVEDRLKIDPLGIRKLDVDRIIQLLVRIELVQTPPLIQLIGEIIQHENRCRRTKAEKKGGRFVEVTRIRYEGGKATWNLVNNQGFDYCAYNVKAKGRPKFDRVQKQFGAKDLQIQKHNNILSFLYRESSREIFALTKGHTWGIVASFTDYEWPRQFCRYFLNPNKVSQVTRESIFGVNRKEEISFSSYQRLELLETRDRLYTELVLPFRRDSIVFTNQEAVVSVQVGQIRINRQLYLEDFPVILNCASEELKKPLSLQAQRQFEMLDFLEKVDDKEERSKFESHILSQLGECIVNNTPCTYSLFHKFILDNLRTSSAISLKYKSSKRTLSLYATLSDVLDALRSLLPSKDIAKELCSVKIGFGSSEMYPLLDFVEGEIFVNHLPYFRINKCFYKLSGDYLSLVHVDFRRSLSELLMSRDSEGALPLTWGGQTEHGNLTPTAWKKMSKGSIEELSKREVRYVNPEKARNNITYRELKGEILTNKEIFSLRDEINPLLKNKTITKKKLQNKLKVHDAAVERIWGELTRSRSIIKKKKDKWFVFNPLLEEEKLSKLLDPLCFQYFAREKEGSYNERYLNQEGFVVGDRICPFGIEIFDLVQSMGDTTYVYHVKEGFDLHARDALDQLMNSVEMIYEACCAQSEDNALDKWYQLATNPEGASKEDAAYRRKLAKQIKGIPLQKFKELFTKRKLVFVYAVLDSHEQESTLEHEMKLKEAFHAEDFEGVIKSNKKTQDVAKEIFTQLKKLRFLDPKGRLTSRYYSCSKKKFPSEFVSDISVAAKERIYDCLKAQASQFNSTIALLALRRTRNRMKQYNFEFQVLQIPRASYSQESSTPPAAQYDIVEKLPAPPPEELVVHTAEDRKFIKKNNTRADGACALHALNGKLVGGEWVFQPDSNIGGTEADHAKFDYLTKIGVMEEKSALLFKCYAEFVLSSDKLTRQYYQFLSDEIGKEEETKLKLVDVYKKILEDNDNYDEIFSELQSVKEAYRTLSQEELREVLLQDAKQLYTAFSGNLNALLPTLEQHQSYQQCVESVNEAQQELEEKRKEFLSKKRVSKGYITRTAKPDYQLTEDELELAAVLYNKKVILFSELQTMVLNPDAEDVVAIEHTGDHLFGHYSRLDSVVK